MAAPCPVDEASLREAFEMSRNFNLPRCSSICCRISSVRAVLRSAAHALPVDAKAPSTIADVFLRGKQTHVCANHVPDGLKEIPMEKIKTPPSLGGLGGVEISVDTSGNTVSVERTIPPQKKNLEVVPEPDIESVGGFARGGHGAIQR